MAIDLQNPQNIGTGWPGPPQFHAPEIGSLVNAILTNRYKNQELQQSTLSDAIKQYQARQSDAAYIQAAQNAGVLPQGDYSNMTAAQAANLAQRIQDMTPDTDADKLKQAMAGYYDKLATTGGTRGGPAGQRPFTQGQQFNALKTRESLLGKQAGELEQQQEDYGLKPDVGPATHGYVMRNGKLDYARTPDEQANPTLVSPGDPLTDPNAPTFTPDVYKQRQDQSAARQQILQEQKRVQQQMLSPQGIRQADVDQAAQAQGLPGTGGAGSNLASGYGASSTDMSADDVRAAYRAGKMTRDEATARLKQLGFTD